MELCMVFSSPIFNQFVEQSPLSVLNQGLITRVLTPEVLDEWFDNTVEEQYTRDLLFSCVFEIMTDVVRGSKSSVYAAYTALEDKIGVSATSVYNKLNGIECNTSAELVRYSANSVAPIIEKLGGKAENPLPGYNVKIIDGNCIKASEHRIKELRDITGGALPGKSLVIYDPVLRMPVDVIPCEDGHAQERSLFNELAKRAKPMEVWLMDRNFCTRKLLFSIAKSEGSFIVRQHGQFPFHEIEEETNIGTVETGSVFEQLIETCDENGKMLVLRRIRVHLKKETRDGDKNIYILTNLPQQAADGTSIAKLYRSRWRIETAFQELEKYYNSEINTLGYPKAALFGFCVALVSYILVAVAKAALSCIHGADKIENETSGYYIAHELSQTYPGMMIALPYSEWSIFHKLSNDEMVTALKMLVGKVHLRKYKKNPRGKKKPKTKQKHSPKNAHVSTAKLISKRKKA